MSNLDIEKIMREERENTSRAIEQLAIANEPVPDQVQRDVRRLWQHVQAAINIFIEDEDRVIDTLVVQATLSLMIAEHERIYARLLAAGLLPQN